LFDYREKHLAIINLLSFIKFEEVFFNTKTSEKMAKSTRIQGKKTKLTNEAEIEELPADQCKIIKEK